MTFVCRQTAQQKDNNSQKMAVHMLHASLTPFEIEEDGGRVSLELKKMSLRIHAGMITDYVRYFSFMCHVRTVK